MVDILNRIYDAKAAVTAREEAERAVLDAVRAEPHAKHERRCVPARDPLGKRTGDRRRDQTRIPVRRPDRPQFRSGVRCLDDEAFGVDCISVLTESDHFLGELAYLDVARRHSARPLLRKDFLSAPYQIAQSAAYGADAGAADRCRLAGRTFACVHERAFEYGSRRSG